MSDHTPEGIRVYSVYGFGNTYTVEVHCYTDDEFKALPQFLPLHELVYQKMFYDKKLGVAVYQTTPPTVS